MKWFAPLLVSPGLALMALPALAAVEARQLAALERRIIAVSAWGGSPADPGRARPHTVGAITLHHQGETFKEGTDPAQYLRNLQAWSRNSKQWLDIPYHYVIDLQGRAYAARDIAFAGDTNTAYDPKGHALIEVVGNFEDVEPNQQQLDAVVDMMALLVARHGLSIDSIAGHKDHADTACPGKNLYRYLESGYFRYKVALRLAGLGS